MEQALLKPRTIEFPPEHVIFAPTVAVKNLLEKAFAEDYDFKDRPPLSGQFPFKQAGNLAIVGPATGSPAAALVLEPLLASGTKNIFLIGTAGGLAPEGNSDTPNLFDVIFPRGVITEEGTSRLYSEDFRKPEKDKLSHFLASSIQLKIEEAIKKKNIPNFKSLIWSTDAPYRETSAKVEHYYSLGAKAVDMELAAVSKLCSVYQANLASALIVSDILGKNWQNAQGNGSLKNRMKEVISAVKELTLS